MVVFGPAAAREDRPARSSLRASARPRPSCVKTPARTAPVAGSTMSPTALTATSAATIRPSPITIEAVPTPDFIAPPPPLFPTVAPAPAPTLPSDTGPSFAASAARYPQSASGRYRATADIEIVKNRSGHDRHFCGPRVEADFLFVQIFSHAGSDVQTEGAAAREKDRVNLLNDIQGIQQICFHCSRRGPSHVDAGDRAGLSQDDSASGGALRPGHLPDLDAPHVGQALRSRFHRGALLRLSMERHSQPGCHGCGCKDSAQPRLLPFDARRQLSQPCGMESVRSI